MFPVLNNRGILTRVFRRMPRLLRANTATIGDSGFTNDHRKYLDDVAGSAGLKVSKLSNDTSDDHQKRQKRMITTQRHASNLHKRNRTQAVEVEHLLFDDETVLCDLPAVGYENFPNAPGLEVGGNGRVVLTSKRIIMTFDQDVIFASGDERKHDHLCCTAEKEGCSCVCCLDCCPDSMTDVSWGASYHHIAERTFTSRIGTINIAAELMDAFAVHEDTLALERLVTYQNPRPNNVAEPGVSVPAELRSAEIPTNREVRFEYSTGLNVWHKPRAQLQKVVSDYQLGARGPVHVGMGFFEKCVTGRYCAVHFKYRTPTGLLRETVVLIDPDVSSLKKLHGFANEVKLAISTAPANLMKQPDPLAQSHEPAGTLRKWSCSLLRICPDPMQCQRFAALAWIVERGFLSAAHSDEASVFRF